MIRILFYLISILFLSSCNNSSKTKSSNPNIIIINVDDLGWKDLGYMGSEFYHTPNIDELSKQGVVFMNAYSGASNCAPSRASLMSGLNTPKHGIYTVGNPERGDKRTRKLIPSKNTRFLNDSINTIPKLLKSKGFVTANFGKWHINKDPLSHGFDFNIGGSNKGNPGKNGYFSPYKIDFIESKQNGEYLTDRIAKEAISFFKKNQKKSFFANISFYSVHTPIKGKKEWIDFYKLKEGENGQDNNAYGAMVSSVDENIGKIIQSLKQLNLYESSLIFFTSDNGGIRAISNQYPLRAGKGSYYEGGIKVPLIIKWPNMSKKNTVSYSNVSQLDFFPTILDFIKNDLKPNNLDGISLKNYITSSTNIDRDLFFHFPIYLEAYNKSEDQGRDPLFRTRPGSVIISNNWKLHYYYEDNETELYNLDIDPGESNNLKESEKYITQKLLDKLKKWLESNIAYVSFKNNKHYDDVYEKKEIDKVKLF